MVSAEPWLLLPPPCPDGSMGPPPRLTDLRHKKGGEEIRVYRDSNWIYSLEACMLNALCFPHNLYLIAIIFPGLFPQEFHGFMENHTKQATPTK